MTNPNAPKLTRMTMGYQLEGQEPETCEVHNRSLIAWDETRGVRKWPSSTDAPFLWMTFIVWHHLNRRGLYAGDFLKFKEECETVESLDDDAPVDPTQPAATPDLSSHSE
ncbi:hypothetical protein [Aeromicrobium fastidiosum]|uniref:Uncharacterized protein n=1 Tax=Aeromicrobium fastidiosum TaxID=52699 RepID=A0A641AS74_9ACTN|nr:hypothetical protein [Aeromicrobium fastidiosum]KAA1380522.1 hypothetical protein ESP62_004920 [Aeromicrobium fastidiosum]MBP2390114.1 hypothetical protein [Aeromicrobium fastidiosum]